MLMHLTQSLIMSGGNIAHYPTKGHKVSTLHIVIQQNVNQFLKCNIVFVQSISKQLAQLVRTKSVCHFFQLFFRQSVCLSVSSQVELVILMKVCQNSFLYFEAPKGYATLLTTVLLYLQLLLFMQGNFKQALKLVRYFVLSFPRISLSDCIMLLPGRSTCI